MLPFLKAKQVKDAGVITTMRKPDGGQEEQPKEDLSGLELAMEDICSAEDRKDYKAMAKAFKAAFEILDSMPHEEGPHTNE